MHLKKEVINLINIIIIALILLTALFMKTGRLSVEIGGYDIGTRHIEKFAFLLFLFWALRLILNFSEKEVSVRNGNKDNWYKVFILFLFFWRGYENYFKFDRALPDFLLIYIILEVTIIISIYYLYRLTKSCFDPITAFFTCALFLWASLNTTCGLLSVYGYFFTALTLMAVFNISRFLEKRTFIRLIIVIILVFLVISGFILSFYSSGDVYGNLIEELKFLKPGSLMIGLFLFGLFVKPIGGYKKYFLILLIVVLSTILIQRHGIIYSFYFPLCISIFFAFCGRGLALLLENKLTTRTIFDRNVTLFVILFLFFTITKENIFNVNRLRLGRSIYEWSTLLHETGEATGDSSAVYGYSMFHSGNIAEIDRCLVFGPYHFFSKGRYCVLFRMKIKDTTDQDSVCLISISTNGGKDILAKKDIQTRDFKMDNRYEYFCLYFKLEKLSELEFGVQIKSGVNPALSAIEESQDVGKSGVKLWVDVIKVIRYG